jgi:hypothetical protein
MKKISSWFPAFTPLFIAADAQTTPVLNLPKDAKVEGTVSDMRTKQRKNNELVVFRSQKKTVTNTRQLADSMGNFATVFRQEINTTFIF